MCLGFEGLVVLDLGLGSRVGLLWRPGWSRTCERRLHIGFGVRGMCKFQISI